MIAKCALIALFVVAVSARPGCGSTETVAVVSTGSSCGSSSGSSSGSSAPTTINRNLVGKGKYPVALKNCGPTPDRQIPVTTTRVTAKVQEKPTIRLPAKIPAPRTISHTCTCYKTILRPRVNQQIITVPIVQRYIETTHKPVIENIQYEAVPVNCNDDGSSNGPLQFVEVGSGSSSSGSSCGTTEIEIPTPKVEVVEAPRIEVVEQPRVEVVEAPRVEVVEQPRVEVVEAPRVVEAVEVPRVEVVEAPRVVEAVEIPKTLQF